MHRVLTLEISAVGFLAFGSKIHMKYLNSNTSEALQLSSVPIKAQLE